MVSDPLVMVYGGGDLARYVMAKSLLEAAHINYVAKGEGGSRSGVGSLWVRPRDVPRVRDLLAALDEQREPCAYCGSQDVASGRAGLAALFTGTGFAVGSAVALTESGSAGLAIFGVAAIAATVAYAWVGRDRCASCGRVRG